MKIHYPIIVLLLLFSGYALSAESISGYIERMEIDNDYAWFDIYQIPPECGNKSRLRLPLASDLVTLVGAAGSSHLLTTVEYVCDSAGNANVRQVTIKKILPQ